MGDLASLTTLYHGRRQHMLFILSGFKLGIELAAVALTVSALWPQINQPPFALFLNAHNLLT